MKKGFTLIEILISIGVISVLAAIAVFNFGNTRTQKILHITANNIVFALEESKSNALAGKNGENQGIYISSDSYTQFGGSTYSEGESGNVKTTIDSNISLSTTASSNSIIFARISGDVSAVSTTTVSITSDPTTKIEIVVGTLGDITVIE